jgi:hypothetical protein
MTATILKLLPDDEVRILQTYISGLSDPSLEPIYNSIGVPTELDPTRTQVAVAQILLSAVQESLPNWGCTRGDGELEVGRLPHRRLPDARLNFNPQHVCTINWADSGPGFSWPEAYYITYLPSFSCHVVTASRDGEDAYGCLDHAIGFIEGNLEAVDAAKQVIVQSWISQRAAYDQERWAYLFDEGLIDNATAQAWADEAWPEEVADDEGCDDDE